MSRALLDDLLEGAEQRRTIRLLPGITLSLHRYVYGGNIAAVLDWPAGGYAAALGFTVPLALEKLAQEPRLSQDIRPIAQALAAVMAWGWDDDAGDDESSVTPSTPEPPPLPRGELITPALVAWLDARGLTIAAELVTARDAYGRAKYGQPLQLDDGRDAVEDCRQELGDALQYAYRALRRGDDTRELMALAQAVVRLLAERVSRE